MKEISNQASAKYGENEMMNAAKAYNMELGKRLDTEKRYNTLQVRAKALADALDLQDQVERANFFDEKHRRSAYRGARRARTKALDEFKRFVTGDRS